MGRVRDQSITPPNEKGPRRLDESPAAEAVLRPDQTTRFPPRLGIRFGGVRQYAGISG